MTRVTGSTQQRTTELVREFLRLQDRGADRVPFPFSREEAYEGMVAVLDRYVCRKCRLTPQNAVPEPCDQCITGHLRARITELEGEFHTDFVRNQTIGRCGHRWYGDMPCPLCALLAVGRPKGLVRRAVEAFK